MSGKDFRFSANGTVSTPLRVFFLCGSYFDKNSKDKRIVLRDFIETLSQSFKSLILEDHFSFRKDEKLLNYNEIKMKSLRDIELLTGLFADNIFILHECISTAAELGLFSGNPYISDKIILLTPDFYSVEENFISGFISLAFNNSYFKDYNIENINYFPGVEKIEISENKKKYHTYFINNELPLELKNIIDNKLSPLKNSLNIKVIENKSRQRKRSNNIYYNIQDSVGYIYLHPHILSALLIALFNIDAVRTKLRGSKNIYDCINALWDYLVLLMNNTVRHESAGLYDINNVKFLLIGIDMEPKKAVSYFVYILLALDLIQLRKDQSEGLTIRMEFKDVYANYKSLIIEMTPSNIKEVLSI